MDSAAHNSLPPETAVEFAEEDIVERIFEAVIEQRLPPGTRLVESTLCEAFCVGRMRIRRALLLLASREIVELKPNRGAVVACPTAEQAREVFEARLAIEPNVARLAVARASADDITLLARHVGLENQAHVSGQRHDAIRLSGQFHTLLAEVASNSVMQRMMRELVTRTSLIIGLFGRQDLVNCRESEHQELVDALGARDPDLAARLMSEHLHHIQAHLDLSGPPARAVDLVELFRG